MSNSEQIREEEKQENQREEQEQIQAKKQEQIQAKKQEQVQLKQEQQASLHDQDGCTAAEVLVKCLEKEGVEYVFGIPGEENLDMMNALEKSNIRVIVVRHEQGGCIHGRYVWTAYRKGGRVLFHVRAWCHQSDYRYRGCKLGRSAADRNYRTGGNRADAYYRTSVSGSDQDV